MRLLRKKLYRNRASLNSGKLFQLNTAHYVLMTVILAHSQTLQPEALAFQQHLRQTDTKIRANLQPPSLSLH